MRFILAAAAVFSIALAAAPGDTVNPAAFAELKWRSIGPPRSGYVAAPAGVPGDPTTYYVGLPEGGVWKTTNAGTTWKPIFDAVHIASVGAVAVAASNHDVVYAGTGNQSGWSFTTGKGVYKSTDAGRTWTSAGLAASQYIGGMAIDPGNADNVLVAALGPRAPGGPGVPAAAPDTTGTAAERGIYRTTDGGKTWTRALLPEGSTGATDVYLDFGDPRMAFALLAGGSGPGVWKSADAGATWQAVGGRGLPDGSRITAFALASNTHGRRLYAVAGTGGRGGGGRGPGSRALYRSDDGGDTWVFGSRDLASAGGKIYADPQHPDVVYLMGTAVYRSVDGGQHVSAFWGAPSGADPRFLWIDPTNSRRLIAGVDQGPAISVDGGESWTPYYGLVNGQFYRVATDYDFPYHVCGPQQDSGSACVASRSDFGEIRPYDWYPGGGFENGFLIADPLDTRYLFTQGWYHVLRRYDKTTGAVIVLYQPTADDRFGGAPPLAFSADRRTLFMASQRLMASADRGATWRTLSPDLTVPIAPPTPPAEPPTGSARALPAAGGFIQALALSPISAAVIWTGASTGVVQVTRDGGKTWTNVTPKNLPGGAVNVIDASHANTGTAYVALLSRDSTPHLYRTSDYGASWQEIASGLAGGAVTRVVREDPADPSILYAGTVNAVYVSFDRGDHWQSLQLNLPTTVVSDLTVHDTDLVISTYGRGFWILDDITPLRQAKAALASTASAFFFTPAPVSRARWDNTQDTPVPPEMVVGENPPEGAILDYYLRTPATSVTMTITDPAGRVVREYSNVAPPVDTTMANVPEYWLMPPTVMPTTAGMHRVTWDLRYPDPPTLNYGYSGNLLDYREYTLSWHAIPGKTPRTTLVGPMVVPGSYTAKLTVDGKSSTQAITLAADPRIPITAAALDAQFRLEQRMVAGIAATYRAVNRVQALRAAIAKRLPGAAPDAAAALKTLDAALAPLDGSAGIFGLAHRDLGRRLNDQLVADAQPTTSIVAGVDTPCATIDVALDALKTLDTSALTDVPVWTPPAAPVCGR
ncbi:MAG TPA: hypothetical protein VGI12_06655 [Vicinamibacterales bacterium]|jgi:photosystem II stability/assembly factor-like uncharacterized protein